MLVVLFVCQTIKGFLSKYFIDRLWASLQQKIGFIILAWSHTQKGAGGHHFTKQQIRLQLAGMLEADLRVRLFIFYWRAVKYRQHTN